MHRHAHSNEASRDVINKLASLFYVVDAMADDVMLGLACEMADFEDAVMATTVLRIWADRIVAELGRLQERYHSCRLAGEMFEEIRG